MIIFRDTGTFEETARQEMGEISLGWVVFGALLIRPDTRRFAAVFFGDFVVDDLTVPYCRF